MPSCLFLLQSPVTAYLTEDHRKKLQKLKEKAFFNNTDINDSFCNIDNIVNYDSVDIKDSAGNAYIFVYVLYEL